MNSKRFISSIVVLAVLTVVHPALAGGIVGVRGGVSVASASLDINQTFDKGNRTGFAGSGFLSMGLGVITLQPEASYVQKGVKDAVSNSDVELDYFELAALAKLGLPLPAVKPHVFGGIAADFEVNKSSKLEIDTANVDWNLIFGADVNFVLGKFVIVGDGRYALGLTDVSKASDIVSDMKNRAWIFSAGVGYAF